jgi:hypothetical protein
MADTTLLQLFIELMSSYDSTVDTGAGSKFRSDVMDPLLTRVGDSPLDTDLEAFLVARLEAEYPDLDVSSFSGIRDLVVRPIKTMLEPIRREINGVKLRQSVLNASQMTKSELDTLLQNFFLSVNSGALATGTARVFFLSPQSIVVPSTASFFTDAGLEYVPVASSAISSSQMAFNFLNGEYYFDVAVQAAEVGITYNIGSGQIIRVDGVLSATRVTNSLPITGGTKQETNEEAVTRAKSSITVKNLSTKRGIRTVLYENFPAIEDVKVVGFGEPEMLRDIVKGPNSVSGVPGGVPSSAVDVSANIHIGGKTDVYIKTSDNTLSANTLELQNVTNYGTIIQSSSSGEIASTGYGSPLKQDLTDVNGFFREVAIDGTYFIKIDASEFAIVGKGSGATADTTLILDAASGLAAASPPRVSISYQIVRRELDGLLKIPLTNLAAESADGSLVLTGSLPSKVIPGSSSNEAYLSGGASVALTENIAIDGNVKLPLFSVTSASLINQVAGTLDDIPFAGTGYSKSLAKFSGGSPSAKALGSIRYYVQSKTHMMLSDAAIAYDSLTEDLPYNILQTTWVDAGGHKFVVDTTGFSGTIDQNDVKWAATGAFDYLFVRTTVVSSKGLEKGDWVVISENTGEVVVSERVLLIEEVSSADFTASAVTCRKITVRFDGGTGANAFTLSSTSVVTSITVQFIKGVHKDSLVQDPITGYYYKDISVIAALNGTSYNIEKGVALTPANPYIEGYKILSLSEGESLSERDIPLLYLTKYINNLNLTLVSTSLDVDLSYSTGTDLLDIQDFVEKEDNRIVSEDILVKHYKPVYVILNISGVGLTAAKGLEILESFVSTLTDTVEVSDLISYLYTNGATRVDLPIEIILERINSLRSPFNTFVSNTLTIDSNEKFYFSASSNYAVTT